jgi:hypothetical protein
MILCIVCSFYREIVHQPQWNQRNSNDLRHTLPECTGGVNYFMTLIASANRCSPFVLIVIFGAHVFQLPQWVAIRLLKASISASRISMSF